MSLFKHIGRNLGKKNLAPAPENATDEFESTDDGLHAKIDGNDADGYVVDLYRHKTKLRRLRHSENHYYHSYNYKTLGAAERAAKAAIMVLRSDEARRERQERLRQETQKTVVIK